VKKISLIIFLILFFFNQVFAQENIWFAFWNKDSTLLGFKDKIGKIKIAPSFSEFTTAKKFENIIGISKREHGKIESYYLTKKGRIVGRDCLYIFDNGSDCESEGFIRFRDNITHKVGMFNSNGGIAIPADYDNLMPVRNGMIMAAKGGHWDASQLSEHNQYPWTGSKEMLIDIHNKVLIANFRYNENINFFSLIISKQPNKSLIRQNFKAVNGKYYSFISFDKEFKTWLRDSLLSHLTESNMLDISYRKITFWHKSNRWLNEDKKEFFQKNYGLVRSKLAALNSFEFHYEIFKEGLNPYEHSDSSKEFEKYYNNCGASKDWIYPVETIAISHQSKQDIPQDQLSFLRTDAGYRLLEVSIKNGEVH
jgi:hypothetical protein